MNSSIMKITLFPCTPIIVFNGDKYNDDKPLFLGHRLSVLLGTPPKTIFPEDIHLRFNKERKLNKSKHSVQLANTCYKSF